MAINTSGRDPRIANAVIPLQADQKATGKMRAVGAITEALANGLLRNLPDSLELLTVLQLLGQMLNLIKSGALNPHPIPNTAEMPKSISGGGSKGTTVTTDSSS